MTTDPHIHFGNRLTDAMVQRGPLCVGLDPFPDRIPALFGEGLTAIERFGEAVIARLAGQVAVLKPQIALFERHGPDGLSALARLTFMARDAGLIVLLDAKRGDIGSTADGYADAYLGPDAWLHADAITVNPYMGLDTIEPYLPHLERGKGAAVLVRTSNPGADELQGVRVSAVMPFYEFLAGKLNPLVTRYADGEGWSSLMFVVGATAPDEARALRRQAHRARFLVPGFGAQGAGPAEALAARYSKVNPNSDVANHQGALVNASRGALYPKDAANAPDQASWAAAFDANLKSLKLALASA